ncbi:GNAT family N-acetyltransferase [Paenibacillus sp. F411]|uniref:GNAT family N-acetyltransferase n=1 Tax=Paenibacillus sp. F411 TaxID=2820239 RepID=UPI001AAFAD77|nr:GNAT family N-acetyltransferase [Paenibacillus sp. F411]MBO2946070.1 GNAT family N-acetyltransferase [Paenibacillus sp. F411]
MPQPAYRQAFYVFDSSTPVPALIRSYTPEDFEELIVIQSEAFPPPYPAEQWWNEEQLHNHVELFPEGALCVEVDGVLAGSITSLIVNEKPGEAPRSWSQVTDHGYIRTHCREGNTLYIADICVRPRFRKLGLGKWLLQALYHVTVELDLNRLLGGGRMPGYQEHAADLTAAQYVDEVVSGRIKDPVITFLLRCGRTPAGIAADYLEDEESCGYAVLMEWKNPFKS